MTGAAPRRLELPRALRARPLLAGRVALAAAVLAAAALLLWLHRGGYFYLEEELWLQLANSPADIVLQPYGGHLFGVPLLVYRAITAVFGADYRAFVVVGTAAMLAVAALFYEYARRRVGPLLALAPTFVLLVLGASWWALLLPLVGIEYACVLGPGLAALLLLERGSRRGDAGACAALCVSVASVSVGLAFLAGAAVSIWLGPDRRRRAWIVIVPAALYAVWRLWAGFGGSGAQLTNIVWVPAYAIDSLAATVTGLLGQPQLVGSGPLTSLHLQGFEIGSLATGVFFAALEALGLFLLIRWARPRGAFTRELWAAVTVLGVLWFAQGLALGTYRQPGDPHYIYWDVLLVLVVGVNLVRGVKLGRDGLLVLAALTGVALFGNLVLLREAHRDYIDLFSATGRPAKPLIARFRIEDGIDLWYGRVTTHLRPAPASALAGEGCESAAGPAPTYRPPAGSSQEPVAGAVLRAARDTRVRMRRFGSAFRFSPGTLRAGRTYRLVIYGDSSPHRWQLLVPRPGALRICPQQSQPLGAAAG